MSGRTAFDYFEVIKRLSPFTLDLLTAETDEQFDKAFDNWLVTGISQLERSKKDYQSANENAISSFLAAALSTGEISVTREENSNGHVDLTVKIINCPPYRVKLGEAKIWRSNKYHVGGIDQLLNRYTTGRECRGFVISYVRERDIKILFENLRKYLDKNKPFDLDGLCKDHNIRWSFLSSHNHNSGELIEICHVGCNLFVEPGK